MDSFRPERWLTFVRFPSFTREWERLGLDDADLRALEVEILKDPARSPVIRGTGGLRKLRFAGPGSGRGKSGAYRVCYASFSEFGIVALVTVFGKDEQDTLTPADCNAIAAVIRAYRGEIGREPGRGPASTAGRRRRRRDGKGGQGEGEAGR